MIQQRSCKFSRHELPLPQVIRLSSPLWSKYLVFLSMNMRLSRIQCRNNSIKESRSSCSANCLLYNHLRSGHHWIFFLCLFWSPMTLPTSPHRTCFSVALGPNKKGKERMWCRWLCNRQYRPDPDTFVGASSLPADVDHHSHSLLLLLWMSIITAITSYSHSFNRTWNGCSFCNSQQPAPYLVNFAGASATIITAIRFFLHSDVY